MLGIGWEDDRGRIARRKCFQLQRGSFSDEAVRRGKRGDFWCADLHLGGFGRIYNFVRSGVDVAEALTCRPKCAPIEDTQRSYEETLGAGLPTVGFLMAVLY